MTAARICRREIKWQQCVAFSSRLKIASSGTQISEMTLEQSSIHKTRQITASKLKLPHRRKIEAETKRLEERKEKRRVLLQKKKEEKDIQKQEIQKEQMLAMVSVSNIAGP